MTTTHRLVAVSLAAATLAAAAPAIAQGHGGGIGGGIGGGVGGGMGGAIGAGGSIDLPGRASVGLPDRASAPLPDRATVNLPDHANARAATATEARASARLPDRANPRAVSATTGGSFTARTSVLSTNTRLNTALTASLNRQGIDLPAGGLSAACSGFATLGGCIAALHVADNLAIPGGFSVLKARTTGSGAVSLGRAIAELKPSLRATANARAARAEAAARTDLAASGRLR